MNQYGTSVFELDKAKETIQTSYKRNNLTVLTYFGFLGSTMTLRGSRIVELFFFSTVNAPLTVSNT